MDRGDREGRKAINDIVPSFRPLLGPISLRLNPMDEHKMFRFASLNAGIDKPKIETTKVPDPVGPFHR